jgi:prophage regulatory protein
MTERILRQSEVLQITGLGRTTLWRLERRGEFPARRRITGNIVGWLLSEVEEWMRSRPVVPAEAGAEPGVSD